MALQLLQFALYDVQAKQFEHWMLPQLQFVAQLPFEQFAQFEQLPLLQLPALFF